MDVTFGRTLRLVGFDETAGFATNEARGIALHWIADARPVEDYAVRFRLRHSTGDIAWESDPVRPVGGQFPTPAWRPGAIVVDFHEFALPKWLEPGTYRIEVGLFAQFSDDGLAVDGGPEVWKPLTDVYLKRSGRQSATWAGAPALFRRSTWLVARDAPQEAQAGAPVDITLSWRSGVLAATDVAESLLIVWRGREGTASGQVYRSPPAGSAGWAESQSHHTVTAPGAAGRYSLLVGWVDAEGRAAPAWCSWLSAEASLCALGEVSVSPAGETQANFDDRLLLLDAAADTERIGRGETVQVALRWRAQRALDEDYTVLVQLLGPDGRLHGQVDSWPVQGTYPTSQWVPGQEVADHYEVRLAADAPPGRYTIHVGWYLLASMQRLVVLDSSGQPVGDTFVIGEFQVEATTE
jgi:hypothetical protein